MNMYINVCNYKCCILTVFGECISDGRGFGKYLKLYLIWSDNCLLLQFYGPHVTARAKFEYSDNGLITRALRNLQL